MPTLRSSCPACEASHHAYFLLHIKGGTREAHSKAHQQERAWWQVARHLTMCHPHLSVAAGRVVLSLAAPAVPPPGCPCSGTCRTPSAAGAPGRHVWGRRSLRDRGRVAQGAGQDRGGREAGRRGVVRGGEGRTGGFRVGRSTGFYVVVGSHALQQLQGITGTHRHYSRCRQASTPAASTPQAKHRRTGWLLVC
jgi:hypothetical protein